jgi:hypothetical protein
MTPLVPIRVGDNRTSPLWRSIAMVSGVAWVSSVPWAVIRGPVDLQWVVFQALGAGVIPAVAGWGTLWRTRGNLRAAVWGTLLASVVVLACLVWSQYRGQG